VRCENGTVIVTWVPSSSSVRAATGPHRVNAALVDEMSVGTGPYAVKTLHAPLFVAPVHCPRGEADAAHPGGLLDRRGGLAAGAHRQWIAAPCNFVFQMLVG
jgi:hypothetical protein